MSQASSAGKQQESHCQGMRGRPTLYLPPSILFHPFDKRKTPHRKAARVNDYLAPMRGAAVPGGGPERVFVVPMRVRPLLPSEVRAAKGSTIGAPVEKS